MKIVNLNFEYIFFLFFFRPSMHNKRLISRKSVLIHVENPFLFFLSLLRQIVRKTRGTRCEIFSLLSENHCAKCDIRMSKQELSKPFGIIYGVLFFPSSFFFHPFPNRRSFKSWEESCANLESRNEKRNISSRLFSTLSTPSLPPTSFQLLGWGFPVDILSMTRVAGCQKREASSRNRGISYFVYTCSTSWFLFREILSTHSRIERRTCVISCMYCRNEYIYLLMYWFLLYIIIICICILYFIVYVYYYLYCW